MSKLLLRSIFIIFLATGLAACGGGTTAGGSSGDGGGGDETPDAVSMGVQIGHDFSEGSIQITKSELTSSDSTAITVYFIDENEDPIADGVITQVTFSSDCVEAEPATATISPNPVSVSSGIATTTYTTNGCPNSDTITVEAEFDGETLTASGDVTISGEDIIRLGSYVDSTFTDDVLDVSISNLSAGGTASVTAYLVDGNEVPLIDGTVAAVTFTSTFTSEGTASITQTVPVVSGRATATYEALGAEGVDRITARAVGLEARAEITVAPADIGAITFVAPDEPVVIALKGTGGSGRAEFANVKFRVVNDFGGPVPYTDVEFELNTYIGELSLTHTEATSDADGYVQTTVNAGYIPNPVIVTASIPSLGISTQSGEMSLLSGIPDQNSITISPTIYNPEIWNYNNLSIPIIVQLGDRYNNDVPDGTPITLTTEAGTVNGQCFTTDNKCTVNWTSQDPRPIDGRVTILAYAIGEESFFDSNGNGRFDESWDHDGDPDTPNILEPFTDMPEAWLDIDEDGCHDTGAPNICTSNPVGTVFEEYKDFNVNGAFDSPDEDDADAAPVGDGIYNGKLCNDDSCADAPDSIHVRQSMVLVMSGITPYITPAPDLTLNDDGCIVLVEGTPLEAGFWLTDARFQQMPATSIVSVSVSGTSISGSLVYGARKWPNTSAKMDPETPNYKVRITGTDATAADGAITVTIETPGRDQDIDADDDNSLVTVSRCLAF